MSPPCPHPHPNEKLSHEQWGMGGKMGSAEQKEHLGLFWAGDEDEK